MNNEAYEDIKRVEKVIGEAYKNEKDPVRKDRLFFFWESLGELRGAVDCKANRLLIESSFACFFASKRCAEFCEEAKSFYDSALKERNAA